MIRKLLNALVLLIALPCSALAQNIAHFSASDRYSIWLNDVNNSNPVGLFSDNFRQVDHAHVSPDYLHVIFTRFNVYQCNHANELTSLGYQNTEIDMCTINGATCSVIVPPVVGKVSANPKWSDNSTVYYVSTSLGGPFSGLAQVNVNTLAVSTLYHPNFAVADPALYNNTLVVSIPQGGKHILFKVNMLTKVATVLDIPADVPTSTFSTYGDFDPQFSSDGTKIVFLKIYPSTTAGVATYAHTVIITMSSGAQLDISAGGPAPIEDAVPNWLSGTASIVFWTNFAPTNNRVGTMLSDGTVRTNVPLAAYAAGYLQPDAYPADASSPIRIVYSRGVF